MCVSSLHFQNSLPVRMKGIVMYNESPFFDVIYAMISPFMKEKTKKRVSTLLRLPVLPNTILTIYLS